MADNNEDGTVHIPEEWEKARVYFQGVLATILSQLASLKNDVEAMIGTINRRLEVLERSNEQELQELSVIREGVAKLQTVFQNVADRYAGLVSLQGQRIMEQQERWRNYDEEQRLQGLDIKKGLQIIQREDRYRNLWRTVILFLGFLLLASNVVTIVRQPNEPDRIHKDSKTKAGRHEEGNQPGAPSGGELRGLGAKIRKPSA